METTKRVESPAWALSLPPTLEGGAAPEPPPGLTAMAVYRGELAPAMESVVILTERNREGRNLRDFIDGTTQALITVYEVRKADVEGADRGHRIDSLIRLEDGLGCADDIEAISMVFTEIDDRFVTLTIRTCPSVEAPPIEEIVASFAVR